jgi:hypothetical protein
MSTAPIDLLTLPTLALLALARANRSMGRGRRAADRAYLEAARLARGGDALGARAKAIESLRHSVGVSLLDPRHLYLAPVSVAANRIEY